MIQSDLPLDNSPVNGSALSDELLNDTQNTLMLLKQWREIDSLRPLDLAFAKHLCEMGEASGQRISPNTLLFAAISSLYLSDGHVCLDIKKVFDAPERFIKHAPEHRHKTLSLTQVLNKLSWQECVSKLETCPAVQYTNEAHAKDLTEKTQQAPLALKGSRLYLSRFYQYEQCIAEGIYARLPVLLSMQSLDSESNAVLKHTIATLFEGQVRSHAASQIQACALAARSQFSIITGGPGTGKTTTVVKLLAALQAIAASQNAGEKLKIALAAPTGKAAARLNQSITGAVSQLPLSKLAGELTQKDIPQKVSTLHRLLGSRGSTREFKYNAQNPLPIDMLVIDEASMVDVGLMAAVIKALRNDARLILLGDKDQLASVDAGAVLGQLAQFAHENRYSQSTREYLQVITGIDTPEQAISDNTHSEHSDALAQNLAMLNHSFRFDAHSGIGQLAKMVNTAERNNLHKTNTLLTQLQDSKLNDSIWLIHDIANKEAEIDTQASIFKELVASGSPNRFLNNGQGRLQGDKPIEAPKGYQDYLQLLAQAKHALNEQSAEQDWNSLASNVLASFERFQVLCAMRSGPYGVEALNELMQNALIPQAVLAEQGSFYHGRPVLVTRNDYNLGLTNGDIGMVIWRWVKDAKGEPYYAARVAFASEQVDGDIRWFSPARLQAIDTVFAMTVHKSQGSEFEHTCIVLPERINPVVTKELLYTAITRAKYWLSIVSPNPNILVDAMNNPISRESGLTLK
jgi:exodeoxyribonuclease V alpha subunit